MVDAADLKAYINRIVDDMDKAQLAAMEKAPLGYAAKIRDKIEMLLEAHYRETFEKWLEKMCIRDSIMVACRYACLLRRSAWRISSYYYSSRYNRIHTQANSNGEFPKAGK